MKSWLTAIVIWIASASVALAGTSTLSVFDSSLTAKVYQVITNAATNFIGMFGLCDGVAAAQCVSVTAAGTAGTIAVSVQGISTGVAIPVSLPSGGFTALTIGTPIAVTTSSTTGTLPAGVVVNATNVGAQGAYCQLGATATASGQYISPNGGWFAFTVGASTQLSCLTSAGTTTVNMVGGSGPATGNDGGGQIQLQHASATSLVASLVVKAAPGTLDAVNCTAIAGAAAGYCIAYNGTVAPATGALTGANVLDVCFFDTTAKGCTLSRVPNNVAYNAGIVILISSATTPFTYTTGVDTGFISADYQ